MVKIVSLICILLTLNACATKPVTQASLSNGDDGSGNTEVAQTYVSLGLTHLEIGNFTEAKVNFDKALDLDPNSGRANYAMAFYYQQVDVAKLTAQFYKNAVNLAGNDADILNSYGEFLCEQGNYDEAKPYFLEAVNYKAPVSTALTYQKLAVCAQNQGLLNEAILHFNTALKYQPNNASALLSLSALYVEKREWNKAQIVTSKYAQNQEISEESLWLSMQIAQGQNDYYSAVEFTELLRKRYPLHHYTKSASEALSGMQNGKVSDNNNVARMKKVAPAAIYEGTASAANSLAYKNDDRLSRVVKRQTSTSTSKSLSYEELVGAQEPKQSPEMSIELKKTNNIGGSQNTTTGVINTADAQRLPFHIVKAKDNLYRISLMYNLKINKLLEWNEIDEGAPLKIGSKLWLFDTSIVSAN